MDTLIKRFKSKTYWVAVIGALLVIIEQNSGFFSMYLPDSYRTAAVMLWPVLMILLREVTTSALSEK